MLWDLICTVPFIMILIEYGFNQIPISWGMILFNLLVMITYVTCNFILVTFRSEHEPIYEDFDWYHKPMTAMFSCFVLLGINLILFTCLWAYTMYIKLPAYRDRDDERLGGLGSETTPSKYVTSPCQKTQTKRNGPAQMSVDLSGGHDSSRMSANISHESNPLKLGDGHMTAAQFMGYNVDPSAKPHTESITTERKPSDLESNSSKVK